jgi:hypothetical protein
MPKSRVDPQLQRKLEEFVLAEGGVRSAARSLELEHTMVWRFLQQGRAIPKNHQAITNALQRQKIATDNATKATASYLRRPKSELTSEDLAMVRRMCTSVIALIDNYNGAGEEIAPLPM